MNAYATTDPARIQLPDTTAVHRANRFMLGTSPVALERPRGWQAEAAVARLLQQHGEMPHTSTLRRSRLRQRIGAALVRAGDRLLTGGLLMEIARVQRSDWPAQSPYPLYAGETPGGGPR